MDGHQTVTLATWLGWPGPDRYRAIMDHPPAIGIHDVTAIAHSRTWLWALSDYCVSSVTGGVIWLVPRKG